MWLTCGGPGPVLLLGLAKSRHIDTLGDRRGCGYHRASWATLSFGCYWKRAMESCQKQSGWREAALPFD